VESAAIGLLAGRFAAAERLGETPALPPLTTAIGALLAHITGGHLSEDERSYQPMNVNFGLFPPLENLPRGADKGLLKKRALTSRAKADLESWLAGERATLAA
jgi:methylenetetrahydrofolate--tRNA-(uracil-5-)-methyltransferase